MVSKELQTKYIQLQLMKQQLSAFAQEKELVDEKLAEFLSVADALKRLHNLKKGDEIWSPMGGSVFVRSDLRDAENVLVGIGAGVVLKKTRTEAIELMITRADELTNLEKSIVMEIKKFSEQAELLENEVQTLAEKEQ